MKKIYAVHQGYELYGSDRVFIRSLNALRGEWPEAEIKITLPAEGPLYDALSADGFKVDVHDLWVLRRSLGLRLLPRLLALPAAMLKAWKRGKDADLIYLSTTVILDHLLVAPFYRGAVVVHAHELPTGGAAKILSALLAWSRAAVVFISQATAEAFRLPASVISRVVHNGHDGPSSAVSPKPAVDRPIKLLMIGRINDWKGQDLLVEALSLLTKEERQRFEVRIVGDTFGGDAVKDALLASIAKFGLEDLVRVEGFLDDPSPLYAWSDVVMAPSRKPEPFGLIAIEGMSWARPVIAAAHGGLVEIVTNETGRLFEPNDAKALAEALRRYAADPDEIARQGALGRLRYEQTFTAEAYCKKFNEFVGEQKVRRSA